MILMNPKIEKFMSNVLANYDSGIHFDRTFIHSFTFRRSIQAFLILIAIYWSSPLSLLCLLVFPFMWIRARSLKESILFTVDFYILTLIPMAHLFLSGTIGNSTFLNNLLLVLQHLSIIPIFILCSMASIKYYYRNSGLFFVLGLLILLLPPFAVADWANPIQGAGLLFPGQKIIGLLMFFLLIVSFESISHIALIACLSIFSHVTFHEDMNKASISKFWSGTQTYNRNDIDKITKIPIDAALSDSNFILFSEGSATNIYKRRKLWSYLLDGDQHIFLGVNGEDPITGSQLNGLAVFRNGKMSLVYKQRQPFPYYMWNPFIDQSTSAYWFTQNKNIKYEQFNLAAFVCYESFLSWPYIYSLIQNPDIMLISANLDWDRRQLVKPILEKSLRSWSSLFNVPYVLATNSYKESMVSE
jgi:hypothetical protein